MLEKDRGGLRGSKLNGNGDLRRESLQDYLGDQEAPPGLVFYISNLPAVQIDFFEQFYTLFWLGSTSVESFISLVAHTLDEIKDTQPIVRRLLPPASFFQGSISITVDRWQPSMVLVEPQKRARYNKQSGLIRRRDTQSVSSLTNRLYGFVESNIFSTTAILCELKHILYNDFQFAVWTDTDTSRKQYKETGITTNLPLTESLEIQLRQASSAVGLGSSGIDQLLTEIKRNIKERY